MLDAATPLLPMKTILRFALLAVSVGLLPRLAMSEQPATKGPNKVLFILQDKITRFDIPGGLGLQVGTAMGQINGVSLTTFRYNFSNLPAVTFNNRTGITDTDGDQIIFKVVGTGRFVTPLVDPTIPAEPSAPPTQVLGGTGGPISGTYEVVAASGKYSTSFSIGETFSFKGTSYNPNPASAGTDFFGAVYIEVYGKGIK